MNGSRQREERTSPPITSGNVTSPATGPGKDTVCPRSSDPFYVVTYYIKWVITSSKHSTIAVGYFPSDMISLRM